MKKTLIITLILIYVCSLFALKVPQLKGHVNDYANILTSSEEQRLESYLSSFESTSTVQIALLTIQTLQDENLEDYSIRVADSWKLGNKDKDNGVLMLVAMKEKELRIEVGYGLEGSMTDAKSGYIIRNFIVPSFKKGEYFRGIAAGMDAVTGVISKQLEITDEQIAQSQRRQNKKTPQIPFGLIIFILMFLFGGFGRRRRGGLFTALFLGSMLGGGRSRGGGFGGFGGGGFSGGGGGFGGGGASGGW